MNSPHEEYELKKFRNLTRTISEIHNKVKTKSESASPRSVVQATDQQTIEHSRVQKRYRRLSTVIYTDGDQSHQSGVSINASRVNQKPDSCYWLSYNGCFTVGNFESSFSTTTTDLHVRYPNANAFQPHKDQIR